MIRFSFAIAVFAITQIGCVSTRGGGAAHPPTSQPVDCICLTRAEVARVQAFKVRCKSKIAMLRAKGKHDLTRVKTKHAAAIQSCKARLAGCLRQAKVKHKCPSCLRPAVIVGVVAGSIGLVAGVVVGVVGALAVKGDI